MPYVPFNRINHLAGEREPDSSDYGSPYDSVFINPYICWDDHTFYWGEILLLAGRAIMSSAPRQNRSPDRCPAGKARLPAPEIDPMLQLEEAANPIRIHIVRNRRSAQLNGMLQHNLQRRAQPFELLPGQPPGHSFRSDSRPKQALIGINIPHAMQQLLIQEGSLNRRLPPAKE